MPIHEYLPYLAVAWTAYFIAVVSPGPATLALAATSMTSGRAAGVSLALGVYTGSFIWACLTSLGLAAILAAYAGVLTILKIVGGLYLLWLAWKSFRSAMTPNALHLAALANKELTRRQLYFKGLMLHLTNPKAILFFGSLYSFGVPGDATVGDLALIVAAVGLQSAIVLHGYAILFSNPLVVGGYLKLRRWFDGVFAAAFGYAGYKILSAKLQS